MKMVIKKNSIYGLAILLTLTHITPLEVTNNNYNSIDFNETIAMSFSRVDHNGKKVTTQQLSSDVISFFIDLFNDFIAYEITSSNYHELIKSFSQKPISLDKHDHLKVSELALFFGQEHLACALLRSYILRFAQHETVETFFEPQDASYDVKLLLRKLYFLLTDDHRVMTYKNNNVTVAITMSLQEILYGRQILIQNSVLNLSNLHLSSLDGIENWLQFSDLEQLDVSNNHLREIPDTVFQAQSIKRLDLSHNTIETISEKIGVMRNLESVDMSNNNLTQLPEAIGLLNNLRRLNADNNQLIEIPSAITTCKKLNWLSLAHNQLQNSSQSMLKSLSVRRLIIDKNVKY